MTRNRTPGNPPDWFIFPGGGQEPGETMHEAVVREVREETGYEVEPGALLWVREVNVVPEPDWPFDPRDHALEFMFAAEAIADHGDPSEVDSQQIGVEWLEPEELGRSRFYPAAVLPALARFIDESDSGPVYLGRVG